MDGRMEAMARSTCFDVSSLRRKRVIDGLARNACLIRNIGYGGFAETLAREHRQHRHQDRFPPLIHFAELTPNTQNIK